MKKLIFILFLTLSALWIDIQVGGININLGKVTIQRNLGLVLGLDLAGGSHLVFETQMDESDVDKKKQALEGLKSIVERRVNLFGVSEPNVMVSSFEGKDRLIVELPGVKNTKEAIDIIGKTAKLEFVTF